MQVLLSRIQGNGTLIQFQRPRPALLRIEEQAILAVFSRLVFNLIPILDESTWK
jgi:hypothetical protein